MLNFVTLGQIHTASINGLTADKDTVVVYQSEDGKSGREKAFEYFDGKFHNHYTENNWDIDDIKYFPKRYLVIGGEETSKLLSDFYSSKGDQ